MPDAIALIQFYLPYLLPRAADWPAGVLQASVDGAVVRLRVPSPTEDLFPSEVDRDLSQMNFTWGNAVPPLRNIVIPMPARCLDRVEAIVQSHVDSLNDASQEAVQLRFFNAAVQVANRFIGHVRAASGATFITGVEALYMPHAGDSFSRTPFTIRWADDAGNPIPAYEGGATETGNTGLFFDPDRGSVSWTLVENGLKSGDPPSLPVSLLIAAREQLMNMRIREAMLSAATACEVANTDYIARKGWMGNPKVDHALNAKHDSFAKKRFESVPTLIDGRSFATDNPSAYTALEDMYRGRNSIIHAGRLEFRRSNNVVVIDIPEATRLLNGADQAMRWVDSL